MKKISTKNLTLALILFLLSSSNTSVFAEIKTTKNRNSQIQETAIPTGNTNVCDGVTCADGSCAATQDECALNVKYIRQDKIEIKENSEKTLFQNPNFQENTLSGDMVESRENDNQPPENNDEDKIDFLDDDDDNDSIPTSEENSTRGPIHRDIALSRVFITNSNGSTEEILSSVKTTKPKEWNEDDKKIIGQYLKSIENPKEQDLALSIAYHTNENVQEIRYNSETQEIQIDYIEEIRLFGLIRIKINATTIIDSESNQKTEYPWWALFASSKKGYDYYKTSSSANNI
jgi:hypothetical protein